MTLQEEAQRVCDAAGPEMSLLGGLDNREIAKKFVSAQAAYPSTAMRTRLLEFRQAIGAREASIRRDDCGDWALSGTSGHVYAVPEGFQLYVTTGERPLRWSWIKKKLAFCRVTQDGDDCWRANSRGASDPESSST
jgi:hypothetical protein